jgi:hypothetical protein
VAEIGVADGEMNRDRGRVPGHSASASVHQSHGWFAQVPQRTVSSWMTPKQISIPPKVARSWAISGRSLGFTERIHSNDVFAYLPSQRVLKEGGYEGGGAMKYSSYPHPGPFADTVEERVVGKARQLVERTAKPAGNREKTP